LKTTSPTAYFEIECDRNPCAATDVFDRPAIFSSFAVDVVKTLARDVSTLAGGRVVVGDIETVVVGMLVVDASVPLFGTVVIGTLVVETSVSPLGTVVPTLLGLEDPAPADLPPFHQLPAIASNWIASLHSPKPPFVRDLARRT
jgi:hypothetical protein